MTCKDCVHYDACKDMYYGNRDDFDDCDFTLDCIDMGIFKNKADVVEVVRCKDCEHYKANSCFNRQWDLESSVEIPLVREDDYCSYGERKCENGKQ